MSINAEREKVHWARLPRDLPALEFKVHHVLPERYRRYLRRRHDAAGRGRLDELGKLDVVIGRYERRAMRSLGASVRSLLDAGDGDYPRRSSRAMSLELFHTHNPGPFNQLIATAVGDWGVQDLEVVVLKPTPRRDVGYRSFPHHCFDFEGAQSPGELKLKTLKLTNCAPLTSRGAAAPAAFSSLAVLVLQGMPKKKLLYERVIRACPALEVLHIKSCLFRSKIAIDAPGSRVKELVFDACTFRTVTLGALPSLESLAWRGAPLCLELGSLPLLARLNLSIYDDPNAGPDPRYAAFYGPREEDSVLVFPGRLAGLESLVVGFTGPEMWLTPLGAPDLAVALGGLRRLVLADMPRSWDVRWACRLLEAARSLETLHVHVGDRDAGEPAYGPVISEPPMSFEHRALREATVAGFDGSGTQLRFVGFLVSACRALESATLLRRGRVRENGFWEWEMVASQKECPWSQEERDLVLREIRSGGVASSTVRILLG
ncbi:hypothetical protein ACP4OV_015250 [Aristida adscensionis]